jgi:hypothetical protein
MRAALSGLLEGKVQAAIEALADIAQNGTSEAARVSAAIAILDRTHGRPRTAPDAVQSGLTDRPFDGWRVERVIVYRQNRTSLSSPATSIA